jgi:hypothetical protein
MEKALLILSSSMRIGASQVSFESYMENEVEDKV